MSHGQRNGSTASLRHAFVIAFAIAATTVLIDAALLRVFASTGAEDREIADHAGHTGKAICEPTAEDTSSFDDAPIASSCAPTSAPWQVFTAPPLGRAHVATHRPLRVAPKTSPPPQRC